MSDTARPRRVVAHRWLAAGTALGAALAGPALAQDDAPAPHHEAAPAAGEGGEAGEAGIAAGQPAEVAALVALLLTEGHAIAARETYRVGDRETGMGHAGHPAAETLDSLAGAVPEGRLAEMRDAVDGLVSSVGTSGPAAEVSARVEAVAQAARAIREGLAPDPADEILALALATRAAAAEYAVAVSDGAVTDPVEYQDAYGFLEVVRAEAARLAASPDPAVAAAGARALAQAEAARAAFGDVKGAGIPSPDPSILYGAAARMELAAGALR